MLVDYEYRPTRALTVVVYSALTVGVYSALTGSGWCRYDGDKAELH